MSRLPEAKKLDLQTSVKLHACDKSVNDVDKPSDNVLKEQLGLKANGLIHSGLRTFMFRCFEFEEEDIAGKSIRKYDTMLKLPDQCTKLFEGAYIIGVDKPVADYIFHNVVGFNAYFQSPCIILKDTDGNVVDIIQYRPSREGYEHLPKYLQEKSQNKPADRGSAFLYPFQVEMERLIKKENFVIFGEGLKNALNALIRSIPFISIESTSNTNNPQLIDYVNTLMLDGVKIYGAMDGDAAGQKAFIAFNNKLNLPIANLLSFDSGLDFTDYIKMENQWD